MVADEAGREPETRVSRRPDVEVARKRQHCRDLWLPVRVGLPCRKPGAAPGRRLPEVNSGQVRTSPLRRKVAAH
eukprot:3630144-Alexandrium_andersonii.AAC.1